VTSRGGGASRGQNPIERVGKRSVAKFIVPYWGIKSTMA
jgi:hypothetical protein